MSRWKTPKTSLVFLQVIELHLIDAPWFLTLETKLRAPGPFSGQGLELLLNLHRAFCVGAHMRTTPKTLTNKPTFGKY